MKKFFKNCMYVDLDKKYTHANEMRNLFINIIYNGFQQKEYSKWINCVHEDTKTAITNGKKEKRLKDEVSTLLNSETELNIQDKKTKPNKIDMEKT